MEQTSQTGHDYQASAWPVYILKGTAIAGVFWISVFLLGVLWLGTWDGLLPIVPGDIFLCTAAWFVSMLILWRQFQIRKLSCILATVIAWCTIPVIWLVGTQGSHISMTKTLPLLIGSAFVAVILTAACITGWKELREGF